MNDKQKPVHEMSKEEVAQWLKHRQQEPLYVGSDEHEGMSLCYVNPALVDDDEASDGKPSSQSQ